MQLSVPTCNSLRGIATVPGDKSISHRALMLGSIAQGTSYLRGWLPAGDCLATLEAMQHLGVDVERDGPSDVVIKGRGLLGLSSPTRVLDCQGSGTTLRLLTGILAGYSFTCVLDGHAGLRRRPMERIAAPLRLMGADVKTENGCPPLTINGGSLKGIDYVMSVASAQVKSAILLAALYAKGETTVHQPGPARDHTERMLRSQGVRVAQAGNTITLTPDHRDLDSFDLTIPADFSSAAYPLVAGLLVPDASLTLTGVGTNPTRTGLLDVLVRMGAHVEQHNRNRQGGEPVADLAIRSSQLHSTVVAGDTVVRMIDEFPIFAVAATQAHGETLVRDASELRVKESDRIGAITTELRKMGAQIEEREDGFVVSGPTPLRGTHVHSHGDHRLAMALAMAGLLAEGNTIVDGAEVIADSFPGFVTLMRELGAEMQ